MVVVGLESLKFGGAVAYSHPNAPGACPTSSDSLGPTNEYCNLHVLKGLQDSEVAQQAEESPACSQMAQVGRSGWRTSGRMGYNYRKSKVCRSNVRDSLVCVGCLKHTAWTPSWWAST